MRSPDIRALALTIALASGVCAAPLAALDLTIEPSTALPGVPATIRLKGPETLGYGEGHYFALHVVRGSDEFYATAAMRMSDDVGYLSAAERWLRATEGATELVLEPGPLLDGVGWFSDFELAKPGSYELRIAVCKLARFDFSSGSLDAPGVVAVSSPVRFVVETPEGVDKEAWDLYRELDPTPAMHSVAVVRSSRASEEVWKRFPESEYSRHIAYIAGHGKAAAEKLPFFEAALQRPIDRDVRDAIELSIATTLGNDGVEAMNRRKDMKAASQLVAEARLRLERLVESTSSLKIKELARTELGRVPTPEKLAARALENLAP